MASSTCPETAAPTAMPHPASPRMPWHDDPFPLILAPMVGLGHVALRRVIGRFGGFSLMVTEMASARAVITENPKTSRVFRWHPEELPFLVCQIFGSDPDDMARAARRIEAEGFAGVDINMGCSVAAITRRGAGAALLGTPKRALDMAGTVVQAVSIPVSVKLRTLPGRDIPGTCALIQGLARVGVRWITYHPRVAPDRRTRPARWEDIATLVAASPIPVVGNGDVWQAQDAWRMRAQTGCAGVSIGRAAVARPWIFAEIRGNLTPRPDIYLEAALAMVEELWRFNPEDVAMRLFSKWLAYFCANFTYGHAIMRRIRQASTRAELEAAMVCELAPCPQIASTANPFLVV